MGRAVFDTTVLVSALLRPGGLADELLTLAAEEQFELVLSSAIILETWRTLLSDDRIRSQYSYSDERAHLYCLSLLEIAIEVLRTTRPLSGIVRDPRDDMVLPINIRSDDEHRGQPVLNSQLRGPPTIGSKKGTGLDKLRSHWSAWLRFAQRGPGLGEATQ
jgi:putative PIN family toxin of toxin-antitoxin system